MNYKVTPEDLLAGASFVSGPYAKTPWESMGDQTEGQVLHTSFLLSQSLFLNHTFPIILLFNRSCFAFWVFSQVISSCPAGGGGTGWGQTGFVPV